MPVDLATPRRVVVKFLDTVILPYEDGAEQYVVRLAIGPWAELAQRYKGIRLDRLFKVLSPERISDLVSEALDRDRHYRAPNLLTFFVVDCPPGVDPVALARGLGEWTQVESAYVDPLDESPALLDNPDYRNGLQTYLKPPATAPPPSPQGAIDAEFAWAQPGGTGLLQKFVDLERGARRSHEDLAARGIPLLHGTSPSADQPHGASVLGVVAAVDNLKGGVGIAYGLAAVGYTSQVMASGVDRPDAVMAAIQYFTQPGESPFGRVLLLEVQLNPTNDPSADRRARRGVEPHADGDGPGGLRGDSPGQRAGHRGGRGHGQRRQQPRSLSGSRHRQVRAVARPSPRLQGLGRDHGRWLDPRLPVPPFGGGERGHRLRDAG